MMKCVIFLAVLGIVSGCQKGASVAFTAFLSKDTTVGSHAVVKYDHVLTNWGGAYQPTTGVFTAPYNGLYSISCTLMSFPKNYVHLGIMKNGIRLSVVFSNAKTFPQSSQTLQLVLNKGDRIWIRNNNGRASKMHDRSVSNYNVFSGFLIDQL
ncbi:otolin-1-like isoform X2 [Ostrea edulis]|uniref:otolin-1-like isoform X2 n=1 Tax=Ostrea edulis TaxID=37623 RepID=UPI0024AFF52F|nr:otolin-1-like isoform X2 [Ostrea edulis]XP_055999799.1 otolin-1-like isoform X2 [Ostrea edulis]